MNVGKSHDPCHSLVLLQLPLAAHAVDGNPERLDARGVHATSPVARSPSQWVAAAARLRCCLPSWSGTLHGVCSPVSRDVPSYRVGHEPRSRRDGSSHL